MKNFIRSNIRKEKTILYDYGNDNYKIVKGRFRESGWLENSSICSKFNDKIIDKSGSLRASLSRARSRIFELGICNPWHFFYTQTFDLKNIDRFSIEDITETFQKKLKAYKRKNKNFKYLLVAELHKNIKAIHLHGLLFGINSNDVIIRKDKYNRCQLFFNGFDDLGFNSLEPIQDFISSYIKYILKYITKDNIKFSNGYRYLSSRGLQRALKTEILLDKNLENEKQFDYVKIFDFSLHNKKDIDKISKNDFMTIFRAKELPNNHFTNILDCVKLRMHEIQGKEGIL